MAGDEYARPTQFTEGVGAGPREVAFYMEQSKTADKAPVIPPHATLLGTVPPVTP